MMFAVLFSRDRALQLDAALRSFLAHGQGADQLPISVFYQASTSERESQYQQLREEFSSYPAIRFLPQTDFRQNLLQILLPQQVDPFQRTLVTALPRLGHRFGRLAAPFLKIPSQQMICFLVDDNLFVGDFNLFEIEQAMQLHPATLGFSLRLGANTRYCYPLDKTQEVPAFTPIAGHIMQYRWTEAQHDFHYPLEVSSSVYRLKDLLPLLLGSRFHNPNTLEMRLEKQADRFRAVRPCMFCYDRSVTFCNPINKTQAIYNNRSANKPEYSIAALTYRFAEGDRIDIEAYNGMVPNACHQEVDFVFTKRVKR